MAEKKKTQTEELRESAQQIFTAGLGALSRAQDEGGKLFQKLVKKGEGYAGPGAERFEAIREELERGFATITDRTAEAQEEADRRARKAKIVVDEQVARAREGLATMAVTLENQVEKAVARALEGFGVPTRTEFESLEKSLGELVAKLEGSGEDATPIINTRRAGGDWFEVRVHGVVVDRIRGEAAANRRAEELQRQNAAGGRAGGGEITVEATGGGWYEVRLDGAAVDKVQGRRAADAAVERIKQQG